MFYIRAGRGEFEYVDFQNAWNDGGSFQGGAFRINTVATGDSPSTCRNYVLIDNCTIKKCYCKGQAGAMQLGGGLITSNSYVKMTNTTTENCFSYADETLNSGGGIYRTGGSGTAQLIMEDCTLKNNYSNATATITWNSGHAPLTLTRCTFQNNYSKTSGGALALYSKATITGCTFTGNYATNNGGAIYYMVYSNTETNLPNFAPQNGSLSIDASTTIQNNTAGGNGGGLWVNIRPITCLNASGNPYTVYKNEDGNQYEVHLTLNGPTISGNTAGGYGGGVYLQRTTDIYKSDLKFNYGTIEKNTATSYNGGGIYVTSNLDGTTYGSLPSGCSRTNLTVDVGQSSTTSNKATVSGNKAQNGGGIYVTGVKLSFNVYANAVIGKSGSGNANQAVASSTGAGGGVYFYGKLNGSSYGTFTMNGGNVDYNTSVANGAGIYIGNGTCTIKGGSITNNKSTSGSGGGVFVNPSGDGATTTINSASAALSIASNEAVHGGGIFVNQGSLNITKSTNALSITNNIAKTANTGSGGGIFAKDAVTISGATISGNKAEGSKGGGLYVEAGSNTITVQSSASITGNKAVNGAGLYAASGNITIQSNSTITSNTATGNGGGIYASGGTVNVSASTTTTEILKGNSAKYGGGIYAAGGTVNFSNGVISNNYASEQGGGLFIPAEGKLTLKGTATLTGNRVPASHKGGGVYLAGVVEVGEASKAASTITVEDNYADASGATVTNSNRNNIYLPTPIASTTAPHKDVITVVENGLTSSSRIGFSVPHNFVPVIYCAYSSTSYDYLNSLSTGGSMEDVVSEDSRRYISIHQTVSPYEANHIYLSSGTWVNQVTSQPATGFTVNDGNVTISTAEGLAWLISYVNGLNDVDGGAHDMEGNTVTLTADVDMDAYSWVPIGFSTTPFKGTFDGNGHTVSGINCIFLGESGATQTGLDLGMFGNVTGNANIGNVFLENAYFSSMAVTNKAFVMGGVAAKLNSSTAIVSNSGVHAEIESESPTSVMGGLVGQVVSGTVHSFYALTSLKGYQMGGLVGSNAGDLYNSFANASFTYKGSGYAGGLAGVNSGTVENCYMRLLGSAPASNFGYLVGDNTDGTIRYSYSPVATYTVSGKEGVRTGLGTYTATTANAYDYKVHDNQVSASNSFVPTGGNKQLVTTLNKWVKQDATHETNYTNWLRTTTPVINGDYPLLRMPANNAVSATNGDACLYYGDINTHLTTYTAANQAICLYGSRENVNTNIGIGTNAPLYIDQDAVITQTGDIQAYVGVTLDNSASNNGANPSFGGSDAIDWHFFSSVLKNSPIGLHYGDPGSATEDTDPYQAYVYPSWNATFTNANGYFPLNLNDYYDEWDLYAYCEPDYHWINLKRNSASHWHEDYPGINIPYTNDTEFVPGKGYMVALAEDNYLQAYGTLNTNTVTGSDYISVPVTCTSSIGWTTREGHNLLGNPYQSYLDFEAFVRKNESLWNEGRDPFYIIIDEDKKDYVLYTVRQSPNPLQASRFLHPHQGFMIDCDVTGTAKFDNSMRATSTTVTASGSTVTWPGDFRGSEDAPCYPLVNLMATDANGNRDIVTVELGRPDKGGALKQDAMHSGKGSLWCRYEGEDYALVFTQPGLDAANIRFACDEDAEFTMTWSTHNGAFSYLHLIDNMTGADIDCLTASEYRFTSRTSDYNSRFRLVFDYTGIDDHEVPEPVEGPATFAYYANGEIHLTSTPDATAQLQIIDMTGRVIVSRDAARHVSTEGLAAGVYVLRLTDGNGTRTQKIILN